MKKRYVQFFALVLLICAGVLQMAVPGRAHGYKGHADFWNKCLGIDIEATRKAGGYDDLKSLYKVAQNLIDVYRNGAGAETEYRKIQRECPWFSWGDYGHRLLFHWGFNNAPKDNPAVIKQIENCLDRGRSGNAPLNIGKLRNVIAGSRYINEKTYQRYVALLPSDYHSMLPPLVSQYAAAHPQGYDPKPQRWSEEDEQAQRIRLQKLTLYKTEQRQQLEKTLLSLQKTRNNTLINAVENYTGITRRGSGHGGAANALATLIYDIHMLSDYDSSAAADAAALPPIDRLERDLIDNGLRRLAFGRGKSSLNSALYQEFSDAARAGRGRSNKYRARCLIDAVEKYLPQILHDQYQEILRTKGIILKNVENIAYKEAA